jgi:hypothetical protein
MTTQMDFLEQQQHGDICQEHTNNTAVKASTGRYGGSTCRWWPACERTFKGVTIGSSGRTSCWKIVYFHVTIGNKFHVVDIGLREFKLQRCQKENWQQQNLAVRS